MAQVIACSPIEANSRARQNSNSALKASISGRSESSCQTGSSGSNQALGARTITINPNCHFASSSTNVISYPDFDAKNSMSQAYRE